MSQAVGKRLVVVLLGLLCLGLETGCELVPRRALDATNDPYTDQWAPRSLPASLVYNRQSHDQSDIASQPIRQSLSSASNDGRPLFDGNPYSKAGLPVAAYSGLIDPEGRKASLTVAEGQAPGSGSSRIVQYSAANANRTGSNAQSAQNPAKSAAPAPLAESLNSSTGPMSIQPARDHSGGGQTGVVASPSSVDLSKSKASMFTLPAPEPTWQELVQKLKKIADLRMQQGSSNWALRQRVVAWLDQDSKEKDPDLTGATWIGFLHEVSSPLPGFVVFAPSDWTKLGEAMLAIESAQPLAVRDLEICEQVLGFGDYKVLSARTIKPGQPFILYCELSGVRHETLPEGFRSGIHSRIEIVSERDGKESVVWAKDLGTAEEICQRRRRDYYVNFRLTAPETLVAARTAWS